MKVLSLNSERNQGFSDITKGSFVAPLCVSAHIVAESNRSKIWTLVFRGGFSGRSVTVGLYNMAHVYIVSILLCQ